MTGVLPDPLTVESLAAVMGEWGWTDAAGRNLLQAVAARVGDPSWYALWRDAETLWLAGASAPGLPLATSQNREAVPADLRLLPGRAR